MTDDKSKKIGIEAEGTPTPEVPNSQTQPPSLEDVIARITDITTALRSVDLPPGLSNEQYKNLNIEISTLKKAIGELFNNPKNREKIAELESGLDDEIKRLSLDRHMEGREASGALSPVEQITEPSLEKEQPISVDSGNESRIDRDLDLNADVNNPNLSIAGRKIVVGIIERQNWGNVFAKLKQGDRLLTFLVPGADFLKLKHLNDVFGPSDADRIIIKRKELTRMPEAEELKSDHQSGTFRVREGVDINDLKSKLEKHSANIDRGMTNFLVRLTLQALGEKNMSGKGMDSPEAEKIADELISRIPPERVDGRESGAEIGLEDINVSESTPSIDDAKKYLDFLNSLIGKRTTDGPNQQGFRMNYGLATVKDDSMTGRLDILNKSLQSARTSRELKGAYGQEYSDKMILDEIKSISQSRNILAEKKTVTDAAGFTFELFSINDRGNLVLDKHIMSKIRTGKFEPAENAVDMATHEELIRYVKKINIIDQVKPFTQKEVENGKLQKQFSRNSDLTLAYSLLPEVQLDAEEIDPNKTEEENKEAKRNKIRREVRKIIETEEKDNNYTSRAEFHSEAIKIEKCEYLSIDVKNVGVGQLLDFEQQLQEVEKAGNIHGEMNEDEKVKVLEAFKREALVAGDKTTESLRDAREKIKNILNGYGLLTENDQVLGEVGGDEILLAIDADKLKKNRDLTIEKLMFEIKEATETRVAKTYVGEALRDNSVDKKTGRELNLEHLRAIKRAEKGIEVLKEIEELEGLFNLAASKSAGPESAELPGTEIIAGDIGQNENYKIVLDELRLGRANFIVTENQDGKKAKFDVIFKTEASVLTFNWSELQPLIKKARSAVGMKKQT